MQYKTILMSMAVGMMVGTSVFAQGISFEHKDWQINCDNTRTCRAAGYSSDDDVNRVTVLLIRKAGKGQDVSALVQFALTDDINDNVFFLADKIILKIGNHSYGDIISSSAKEVRDINNINDGALSAPLTAKQTKALLQALKGTSKISFVVGKREWILSTNGASAVLLKMDAEQGRVGTPSALIKKGNKAENNVLPALPAPVIYQKLLSTRDVKLWQSKIDWVLFQKELLEGDEEDNLCDMLDDPKNAKQNFKPEVEAILTHNHLLISAECEHNTKDDGVNNYWIINQEQPYHPKLIIVESFLDGNKISSVHRKRGQGDCSSFKYWRWNGEDFIKEYDGDSGLCRMIAGGGAWDLPTYVSIVK